MTHQTLVGIVIVGYNSKKHVDDCFLSILRSDYQKIRIIFVDNNSSDKSIEYVASKYPSVITIASSRNIGFAGANNLGIIEAKRIGAQYVFMLNPDAIIDDQCISNLVKNASPRVILQPLVLLHNKTKTDLINSAGNRLNFLGISYCGDYKKNKATVKSGQIVSASGAAMFAPLKAICDIGMFDESYFMYHEDLDLCWRARIAGFEIELIANALVWHKYHFSRNSSKMYYFERNRLFFLLKNFQAKTLLLIAPMLLLHELLVCAYSIKASFLIAKLKSYFSIVLLMPTIIASRKLLKRVQNDRSLKIFINDRIQFEEVTIPFIAVYNKILNGYWKIIFRLI